MRDPKYIAILLAVSAFLFFFALGDMPLTDPDETFYAQTAKEMVSANEWITPHIFGKPQFEKPILYYWLIEASYLAFGVNEFSARFPSAVFGLLGVLGIYLLGRLLFSPLCGFLSGLIAATSVQYLIMARGCVTDMVLLVFVLFTLAFFVKAWITPGDRLFYVLSAVMAAFAVLTKGPIGLFIPGAVILLYLAAVKGWGRLKEIPIVWCVIAFAVVAAPWYVIAAKVNGMVFINEFFGFQNIVRFTHPEHKIGSSPIFYFPVILGGVVPWTLFMIFGAWEMFREKSLDSSPLRGYRGFLLAWFLLVFVFFSISKTKLVTYIFPLFPVLFIVTGRFWEKAILENKRGGIYERHIYVSYILLAALCVAGVIGGYFALKPRYAEAVPGMILGAAIFSIGFAVAVTFLFRGKKAWSFGALVAGLLVGTLPVVFFILPVVGKRESSKPACEVFKKLSKPGEIIAGESDHRRGIAFYADRTDVADVQSREAMRDLIFSKDRVWCVIQRKHYTELEKDGVKILPVIVYEGGKKMMVTNKPLDGQGGGKRDEGRGK